MPAAAIVTVNGQRHARTAERAPYAVFVAEMPMTSDPRAAPNSGIGTVEAWLDPEAGGGVRLAEVRRTDGSVLFVRTSALRCAANVTPLRITPRQTTRRTA